jgi:hypothetical protein
MEKYGSQREIKNDLTVGAATHLQVTERETSYERHATEARPLLRMDRRRHFIHHDGNRFTRMVFVLAFLSADPSGIWLEPRFDRWRLFDQLNH